MLHGRAENSLPPRGGCVQVGVSLPLGQQIHKSFWKWQVGIETSGGMCGGGGGGWVRGKRAFYSFNFVSCLILRVYFFPNYLVKSRIFVLFFCFGEEKKEERFALQQDSPVALRLGGGRYRAYNNSALTRDTSHTVGGAVLRRAWKTVVTDGSFVGRHEGARAIYIFDLLLLYVSFSSSTCLLLRLFC